MTPAPHVFLVQRVRHDAPWEDGWGKVWEIEILSMLGSDESGLIN